MAEKTKLTTHDALNIYGLGARISDVGLMTHNPEKWLMDQVMNYAKNPRKIPKELRHLKTTKELFTIVQDAKKNRNAAKKTGNVKDIKKSNMLLQKILIDETFARSMLAIQTDEPFNERLVRFWSNHFCISITNKNCRPFAGSYEREAIRPFIHSRFEDMLLSVASHPAMLIYLDNIKSVGPNSRRMKGRRLAKKKRKGPTGLNENLAREILELHTLGVDGGYSQSDVRNFAESLTGWTIAQNKRFGDRRGEFIFIEQIHEPGDVKILGQKYSQSGIKQAIAVLKDLANHPSTARFICEKLSRHFTHDTPPASLVNRLIKVFNKTGGHLGELSIALIKSPEIWTSAHKFKNSDDYIISALRAFDPDLKSKKILNKRKLLRTFDQLGQPLFKPPSPKGWPDDKKHWSSPDILMGRIEWASYFAPHIVERFKNKSAVEFAESLLGADHLSKNTRRSLERAESGEQAITLLLSSPEFQWRSA